MKKSWLIVLMLVTACAPSIAPTPAVSPLSMPSRQFIINPIQIDQVKVRVEESLPAQVFAEVTGIISDGCSEVMPAEQTRAGNTVTFTINRQRPAEAMCIQIAKTYEATLQLTGDFPPGEYVLKVNDVTQAFTIK